MSDQSADRGPGRLTAGIDSGSWTTKAVVIDDDARVRGSAVVRSAADLPGAAEEALALALHAAGIIQDALSAIWSTGFGRNAIPFAAGTRTELDCHARGVRHYVSGPLTIIDIGGQDAKVIRLDPRGRRIAHKMNRKCAAGTGSFLDEMALRLDIPVDRLHDLASGFQEEVELGSFCTVFSGTELLAAIRQGKRPADLARAAYKSVVKRVLEMDVLEGMVVATGGVVAHHPMVVTLLEQYTRCQVIVPPYPQEMGAFGAALAAREACAEGGSRISSEGAGSDDE
jgi:predicted CoA-substrate-specific enzyme activase